MHESDRFLSSNLIGEISSFFLVAIHVTLVINALILVGLVVGDNSRRDGPNTHFDGRPEPANLTAVGNILNYFYIKLSSNNLLRH
jgi:hypothetical protein